VAVLDGGFEVSHPAMARKRWTNAKEIAGNGVDDDGNGYQDDLHGWNFVENKGDVWGGDNYASTHGTHVAGDATRGTDRLNALMVRVDAGEGSFPMLKIRERIFPAIDYAVKSGARVLNMSLAVAKHPFQSEDVVKLMKEKLAEYPNLLVVLAASNENKKLGETWVTPNTWLAANVLPNLVVVAASDAAGKKASFSNYGRPYATVAARGVGDYSTGLHGTYNSMDGTSFASPTVASIVGKCLLIDPTLTPPELKALLVETSDKNPEVWGELVEAQGTVNAGRAYRLAALRKLVREGVAEGIKQGLTQAQARAKAETDAAAKLELSETERARLLPLVP
jgi:subtilisin family serine protease